MKQLRLSAILRNEQINTAVLVKVAHCRTALRPINHDATFLASHGCEVSFAIIPQPKAAPTVATRNLFPRGEKVLREKDIVRSIAIDVRHADPKNERPLHLDR